jgi:hypothetical protein
MSVVLIIAAVFGRELQPGRPPKLLSEGDKATFTLQGDALTVGGQVKLEVAVDQLPPMVRERITGAAPWRHPGREPAPQGSVRQGPGHRLDGRGGAAEPLG